MKGLRKSFGTSISFLLILIFSVAVIPLDFYHNHGAEQTVCSELAKTGYCHHKLHLSQKAKYCWVCAVHFDRHFAVSHHLENPASRQWVKAFSENKGNAYFASLIFTALRGPPAE